MKASRLSCGQVLPRSRHGLRMELMGLTRGVSPTVATRRPVKHHHYGDSTMRLSNGHGCTPNSMSCRRTSWTSRWKCWSASTGAFGHAQQR